MSKSSQKIANPGTQKILMMGRMKAGKTSIHSILFSDFTAYQTKTLPFTNSINESSVMFLGHKLRIDDCGGQDELMMHYIKNISHQVFTDVEFLIYVFDIQFKEKETDFNTYKAIIENLLKYSKNARIFVLLHKTDIITDLTLKEKTIASCKAQIEEITPRESLLAVYGTSIWDESLYVAWSNIIKYILPDIRFFNESLASIANTVLCDEVILVEKFTFLVLGSYSKRAEEGEIAKYETISRMVKNFKIECAKNGKEFSSVHINSRKFSVIIQEFTKNTYILMLFYNKNIKPALVSLNLKLASQIFENSKNDELKNLKLLW